MAGQTGEASVVNLFTGRKLDPTEVAKAAEGVPMEQEKTAWLTQYLEQFTPDQAMQFRHESDVGDKLYVPKDLEAQDFTEARTFTGIQVDKIIFEELLTYAGDALTEQQRRAINIYVQMSEVNEFIAQRSSSLRLPEQGWSRAVEQLRKQIYDKRLEIVSGVVPEDIKSTLEELRVHIEQEWQSREWRTELHDRTKIPEHGPVQSGIEFLNKVTVIESLKLDGEDRPINLTRQRQLRAAQDAFKTGMPHIVTHPDNSLLQDAAEIEWEFRQYAAEVRTNTTADFFREKVQLFLTRKQIKGVD